MPLIQDAPDTLLYIDTPVSAEQLSAADTLVQAELDPEHATKLHPCLPAQPEARFTDLIEAEHARISAGLPKDGGMDLSRYELLDAPEKGNLPGWKSALSKAYASAEYLRGREINLHLLDAYGKNAWLIGNSHLEDTLTQLEKELEETKLQHEQVEQSRRTIQTNIAGEMHSLESGWKTGVGRMIEAQAAGEKLRQEILELKRQNAS